MPDAIFALFSDAQLAGVEQCQRPFHGKGDFAALAGAYFGAALEGGFDDGLKIGCHDTARWLALLVTV